MKAKAKAKAKRPMAKQPKAATTAKAKGLMRARIVNSGDAVDIKVSASGGKIRVFDLPPPKNADPNTDDAPEIEIEPTKAANPRTFRLAANSIMGVSDDNTDRLTIDNPSPERISITVVGQKDPWPRPPPPPPGDWDPSDRYEKRCDRFLGELGVPTTTPLIYDVRRKG